MPSLPPTSHTNISPPNPQSTPPPPQQIYLKDDQLGPNGGPPTPEAALALVESKEGSAGGGRGGRGGGKAKEAAPKKEKATRAPSAFLLFTKEKRPTLEAGLAFAAQQKALSDAWKVRGRGPVAGSIRVVKPVCARAHNHHTDTTITITNHTPPKQALPEAEKAKYVTASDELKAAAGGGAGGKGKKGKGEGSEGPKLPRSAYQLFCNEQRGSLAKGLNVGEQAKELSARWAALGDGGKAEVAARLEQLKAEAAAAGGGGAGGGGGE